jgi:hypothetical protein
MAGERGAPHKAVSERSDARSNCGLAFTRRWSQEQVDRTISDVEGFEMEVLKGAERLFCDNGRYAQIEGHADAF